MRTEPQTPLRIVHCLRAPVGGLFRHVIDLVTGQSELGHEIGVICDSASGDSLTEEKLARLERSCALGLKRVAMSRHIAPGDLSAALTVRKWCRELDADVIHGHGAKGGAYARFAALRSDTKALYTPHGGSLHYSPSSPQGLVFLKLERLLSRATDGLIFESEFGRDTYAAKVGKPYCPQRVINNGLAPHEFNAVVPNADAADFLFIGELRDLKGVEVLLRALHKLNEQREVTAVIVGSGPDGEKFRNLAESLDLRERVSFTGALPACEAFPMGKTLVVPSHAESFPYIVLEAIAGSVPLIATNVGGIPEIFGPERDKLVPPGDVEALCRSMIRHMDAPEAATACAQTLNLRAAELFSTERMVASVLDFYRHCTGSAAAHAGANQQLSAAE